MISVEGLSVEFNATPLFEDVSYVINKKDRIALVGKNGAGKSTMLKILAGLQSPTRGVVATPKDVTIGYLPQVMILSDNRTVMGEAELAFEHIFELQAKLERMNQELAERTDYDSEEYHQLIDRFTHENDRFLMMGGTNFQAEIERTLLGLGFSREDFERPTSEFSGGWRMRIELAKLLLRRPDVLLLDEPTNHLDIESIQWLENFLSTRANAVVLVSHDRAFLNNVTTRTIEITCGQIYDYKVKYDEFVVLRKERREQQLRAYENQQKQIQDTEDFIERFRYKATKAVQVQSRIKQLEIEREAIKRENDKGKLEQLNKEIADLKDEETKQKAQWQSEKEQINKIQQNKIDIENLKFEADKAEREGDYGKVAEIRYGKIKQKEEEIREVQEKLKTMQGASAMIKEEVDSEDIADVVSRWRGIPVSKMMQSEKEKLLHLESELHTRVIGQEEAISAIADAVRRSRAGLQDPKRPIGSFIFLGTTGVGKTELAKALAEYLFDDENMMTRIDMSEYQEKFSATRLIGAPPGYVGYDEGGQLTEAIRRKPYSVVLFDEIEKAHPDVFNILLQVLDDGRLTDNKGRVVNFKNTIIIMTSNMGSSLIRENFENMTPETHDQVVDETKVQVLELLKKTIRPEFLNRIDDIIMFTPLNEEEIRKIVTVQLNSVKKMLAQNGIALEFTDAALAFISDKGFDPQFGARPVKRVIQKYVLNELSKELLGGKINKDRPITIDSNGAGLVFKN